MESYERTNSIRPAGVLATACRQTGPYATREVPAVIAAWISSYLDHRATPRLHKTGRYVAERIIIFRVAWLECLLDA